ncbi:glycosyltransferase [Bacillus sp. FJAT-45350]|uniref:glycosyltransferase n=1 Tax=Bacillus sp. FJAT-45350 TaxID=2011014 RepID=UPI000BB7798E|nr:glycosyltransferase [Bacillus sp. FJAT-45350]
MKDSAIVHYLMNNLNPYHDEFIYNQISRLTKFHTILIGPFHKRRKQGLSIKNFYNIEDINFETFIKEQNVKVIHSHHGGQALTILQICKHYNIPLIVSMRGRDGSAHEMAFQRNWNRYKELKEYASMYLPVCQFLANDLLKLGFPKEKINVLYGGIDVQKFPYVEHRLPLQGKIRLLSVGRLVKKKGFDTLLDAFMKVHEKYPMITLDIIGYGSEWDNIESIINRHQLNQVVRLRGRMKPNQIIREMKKADIFCLASQTASDGDVEGIPNALKEAMASGLPVISTKNGGITELITHHKTGYLVPERNPEQLAIGIEFFIENPEIWTEYTRNARLKVEEQFNLEKQIKVQEEFYERVR